MTRKQEVEILYRYIVDGKTMNTIADSFGVSTSDISEIVRGYGFNQEERRGWQRGADCGNYGRGKRAAHGVQVTREIIDAYVRRADEWDWDFESFCAAIAEDREAERRREQEEIDRQNRRKMEQEQAARQRQEAQRRQEEAEARAKEQRERDYDRYIEAGKRALREGRLKEAWDQVRQARSCKDTWETNYLLAEACARAGNAAEHADTIIKELTEYADNLAKHNGQLSADQHLWLARAYLAKGDRNRACGEYYRAGDIYYEKGELGKADELYTEGNQKTGYYSGDTPNAPLRMAMSRAKKPNMTVADHEYCAEWLEIAIDKGDQEDDSYLYALRARHLLASGDSDEAKDCAQGAIDLGCDFSWVYGVLLEAQVENYDIDDALETLEKMEEEHIPYEPWLKGEILRQHNDHEDEEAVPWFEKQLQKDPNHEKALAGLLFAEKDYGKRAAYGLRLLRILTPRKDTDREVALFYPNWAESTLRCARLAERADLIRQALEYNPEVKAQVEEAERKIRDASGALARGDYEGVRSLLESIPHKGFGGENMIYELPDSAMRINYSIMLGEAYARSQDAGSHAKEITDNLGHGLYELREQGKSGTAEQNLWVARAYLEQDKKGDACAYFFRAGDIYYRSLDFAHADALYTEGREKTGYYSGSTQDAAYHVAYAREKARGQLTRQDHSFCANWYQKSIGDEMQVKLAYCRRLMHLLELGEDYREDAADCARDGLEAGAFREWLDYQRAFHAFYRAGCFQEALEVVSKAEWKEDASVTYPIGVCLLETGETGKAMEKMLQVLKKQPDHTEALDALLEHGHPYDRQVVLAGLKWLETTGSDGGRAAKLLARARTVGDDTLIRQALEYNPEEKARLEREAQAERERLAQEAAAEKRRREEELLLMLL